MNILEYAKRLTLRFTKNDVNASIDTISSELVNITLPLFEKRLAYFRRNDKEFLSEQYRRDRDAIIKDFSASGYLRVENPFDMIYKSLLNSAEILNFLKGYFDKNAATDITMSGLNITKTNALQLIDLIGFASTYSYAWLELVLSAETNNRNNITTAVDLTPLMIKYLGDNRAAFGQTISVLATPVKVIEKLFEEIPDIIVSENGYKATTAVLGNKVDPLRLNLIQSKFDPFYLWGMISTDYYVNRYKAAKENAEFLELKILRLERLLKNEQDPKLADIIEKRKGQLDKIRGKMAKIEADANAKLKVY
jgi:hypothetical protein